jgi:hypothetical protein
MTSVYNLLREGCGISQTEAAENVHEARLDTVKSWSSDRRPAPSWAINQLQSLARRIRRAGEDYAVMIKKTAKGNIFIIGFSATEEDVRACGFPSMTAQDQAIAIAISLLPDDAEIRLVEHVRGDIPAPTLEKDVVLPTATDRQALAEIEFQDGTATYDAKLNHRRFERLEDIGWIKGTKAIIGHQKLPVIVYELTQGGSLQRSIEREVRMAASSPIPPSTRVVVTGMRLKMPNKLTVGERIEGGPRSFSVAAIDGDVVTVINATGDKILLSAPPELLRA